MFLVTERSELLAITDFLKKLNVEEAAIDKILDYSDLMDDLEADSLDLVELHMAFEEALDIKIPDETLAKLQTVGDIVEYLKEAAE